MQDAVVGSSSAEGTPTASPVPDGRTRARHRLQNTNLPPTSVATQCETRCGPTSNASATNPASTGTPGSRRSRRTRRRSIRGTDHPAPTDELRSRARSGEQHHRFAEMEAAIFSANVLKAKGTPMVVIDLLRDLRSNPDLHPLRAVSGLEEDADFFEPTLVSDLDPFVQQHLLGPCRGELTVVKEVVRNTAAPSSITGRPALGFAFVATTAPDPDEVSPGSATTGADGTVVFERWPTVDTLTIAETRRPGYTLHQRAGDNANCRRSASTHLRRCPQQRGGRLHLRPRDLCCGVTCTLYNRAPPGRLRSGPTLAGPSPSTRIDVDTRREQLDCARGRYVHVGCSGRRWAVRRRDRDRTRHSRPRNSTHSASAMAPPGRSRSRCR